MFDDFLLTNIDQLGIMGFDHIWSKINPETLPGLSPNLYYNENIRDSGINLVDLTWDWLANRDTMQTQ